MNEDLDTGVRQSVLGRGGQCSLEAERMGAGLIRLLCNYTPLFTDPLTGADMPTFKVYCQSGCLPFLHCSLPLNISTKGQPECGPDLYCSTTTVLYIIRAVCWWKKPFQNISSICYVIVTLCIFYILLNIRQKDQKGWIVRESNTSKPAEKLIWCCFIRR